MNTKPHGQTDDQIRKAILEGRKLTKNGVDQQMDPFKDELSRVQIDALVGYARWVGAQR